MTKQEILKVAKPITFTDAMVKNTLNGNLKSFLQKAKTQPELGVNITDFCEQAFVYDQDKKYIMCKCCNHIIDTEPKFNIGDILYVREYTGEVAGQTVYRADFDDTPKNIRFTAPSSMSKNSARIYLQITDIDVCKFKAIDRDTLVAMGFSLLDWYKNYIGYVYVFEVLNSVN